MYQKKIKENNEKKVFHYIYQKRDNLSIADISSDLNISFPTVKTIINKFLKESIIKEDLKIGFGAGRKAQYYSLENNFIYSIGVSVHLKELKIVLGNERGELLKEVIIKDEFLKGNLIERIDEILEEFLSEIDNVVKSKLVGIGISVPGIVDEENNIIELTSSIRVNLDKVKSLSEKYGRKILIDNEANLCAISEKFLGIGKEFSNFAILNINETLNMSNFTEEDEYGEFSFKASRVNHMVINFQGILCECGNKGCWGEYVSDISLLKRVKKIEPNISKLKDIFKSENLANREVQNILEEYIGYISIGIKNIIFMYNPEKIIISGGIFHYKDSYREILLDKVYNKNIFFKGKETIKFSNLGGKGIYLGAAMLPLIDELF
ncbi:ROK family protein [uncultured Cetobacterium sp.]|uniref:ROK family protein n=1 Tax=uncultured Cetobacterium sp. TaxID=527638 RepID=UPI002632F5B5|nr:ROK family protein [uncultured Cetobacterium sp.]